MATLPGTCPIGAPDGRQGRQGDEEDANALPYTCLVAFPSIGLEGLLSCRANPSGNPVFPSWKTNILGWVGRSGSLSLTCLTTFPGPFPFGSQDPSPISSDPNDNCVFLPQQPSAEKN